ncbi:NhaP-type Na+/H+ or K+/H+ antiporter [Mycolicibacterium sp. BK556]|uniref:cation:proton antiporter n=1 Tax=unclassified Mycolicibacterium TaxID=2636767 RepID=UPI00105BC504|nr:cation:proton antiporter [Mycobacterium sp. BK086]MBB3601802.1 NhaP-type Na+/H+ or K+/H+ antiporter [Mycolicibacterium sp. BK556]TDO14224.1 NhaP-type Na+/H+ or K+/H+ antiporter [Mycobacterium sp. BK086]
MVQSLIALSVVLTIWSLLARPMQRGRITAPILLVVVGAGIEYGTYHAVADTLNSTVAQHLAELILAVLVFVDATDVRGGLLGRDPRSALRLLGIALPLSIGLAYALGWLLLPGMTWPVLLVLACIVVPTDFAPASRILRDARIPERVRELLNVEAGYKDGIIAPVLVFALALASGPDDQEPPMHALAEAVPEVGIALIVGPLVGVLLGWLANVAERRNLMTDQSKRIIYVAAPLLSYSLSVGLGGNGFVAAFLCGMALNYVRQVRRAGAQRPGESVADKHRELELIDDVAVLLTAFMWFTVAGIGVIALMSGGVTWGIVGYTVVAVTVVRLIPVMFALLGSDMDWRERLLLGWLGPRGTTSIVFGLLAFNVLEGGIEKQVLLIMVLVVLTSVLVHGLSASAVAHVFARSRVRRRGTAELRH